MVSLVTAVSMSCTHTTWNSQAAEKELDPPAKVYPRNEQGINDSLVDWIARPSSDLNIWAPDPEQAGCVAQRLIRRIGVARLLTLGYDTANPSLALPYTPDERQGVINLLQGCINFDDGLADLWSSSEKVTTAEAVCMSAGAQRRGLAVDLAVALVDGKAPKAFDENSVFIRGIGELANECLEAQSLNPALPPPNLPSRKTADHAGDGDSKQPPSAPSTSQEPLQPGGSEVPTSLSR